jgi:hypothetical protein
MNTTMAMLNAGSSGMAIVFVATTPWHPLLNGLVEADYEGFCLIS